MLATWPGGTTPTSADTVDGYVARGAPGTRPGPAVSVNVAGDALPGMCTNVPISPKASVVESSTSTPGGVARRVMFTLNVCVKPCAMRAYDGSIDATSSGPCGT